MIDIIAVVLLWSFNYITYRTGTLVFKRGWLLSLSIECLKSVVDNKRWFVTFRSLIISIDPLYSNLCISCTFSLWWSSVWYSNLQIPGLLHLFQSASATFLATAWGRTTITSWGAGVRLAGPVIRTAKTWLRRHQALSDTARTLWVWFIAHQRLSCDSWWYDLVIHTPRE